MLREDTEDGSVDTSTYSFGAENFAAIRPTARCFTGFSINFKSKLINNCVYCIVMEMVHNSCRIINSSSWGHVVGRA